MCPGRGEEVEGGGGCQSSIQEEGHDSVVLGGGREEGEGAREGVKKEGREGARD